jgi:hypothetical protein
LSGQWGTAGPTPRTWHHGAQSFVSATVTYPGTSLKVCVVNAGIYGNAVFVIPLLPLKTRHSYTVTVKYSGKLQSKWVFKTAASGG